jgi:hypothetical protein
MTDRDDRYGTGFPATSAAPNTGGTYRLANVTGPLDSVTATVASAPGSPIVCDILRSTDGGTTWSSLWATAAAKPTIATGATSGSLAADPTIVFSPTDRLVAGVASGSGTVTISLTIRIYDSG